MPPQRHPAQPDAAEQRLRARLKEFSVQRPRAGYRTACGQLRQEGLRVNVKRVQRLWREEGLKVPRRQCKKRRLGTSANGSQRRVATRPNEVWSYDFVSDQTRDGRRLKYLCVVDEFTWECLALAVRRSFRAKEVIAGLAGLIAQRGAPAHLRSDNGPEFVALAVQAWLKTHAVGPLYIAPGSPWENAYVESFNSRLRDEHLNREEFASLLEAEVLAAGWRRDYNEARPHSSLEYLAPAVFAARWRAPVGAPPLPAHASAETIKPRTKTLIALGSINGGLPGVSVHYCAEQFENDGSSMSTVMKSMKRTMAGEYSRELSLKVFQGACRLIQLGYKQGGTAGFGLRRMLIDQRGQKKALLKMGEQKSIQTDRVVLVAGPEEEVKIVRRIYHAFIAEGKSESEIAATLNAQGVQTDFGREWNRIGDALKDNELVPKKDSNNQENQKLFHLFPPKFRQRPGWIYFLDLKCKRNTSNKNRKARQTSINY